jgi:ubiquinone/menaquinone biosynthesis C-methylase UbiE
VGVSAEQLTLEERFRALLEHLGLAKVHVAGGYALDAVTLARAVPDAIASMALVCPFRLPSEPFRSLQDRVLFFSGDSGPNASSVPRVLENLPRARSIRLQHYADAAWADAVAERRAEIEPALLEFLAEITGRERISAASLTEATGTIAGLTYQVRGSGPPLLLLPLSLARSQWDPVLDTLASSYTTIILGGAYLGFVPTLEARMRGGYQTVVRNVVDAAQPRPGDRIVEVGCGSGAVIRWLAHHTDSTIPLTGVDVNQYLLREARNLTELQGLSERITFQPGDAEDLPLPSASFDVTLSFTVMEEVDAERMLAELVRVTRPGGRVGVVVRATDMPTWMNLDLSHELRNAVEAVPGAGAEEHGCADRSLYRRFVESGLQDLVMGPQFGTETAQQSPERLRLFAARIAQGLPAAQSREFRESVRGASEAGTMVWAEPYHCALGRKP